MPKLVSLVNRFVDPGMTRQSLYYRAVWQSVL
jgi:hypothetical protein